MKVTNGMPESVKFEDLDEGQCFRWENSLLIKTNCGQDAVDLADGAVYSDMCKESGITPANVEARVID